MPEAGEAELPIPDPDKMEETPVTEPSQMTSTMDMIRAGVKYKPTRPIRRKKSLFEWFGIKKMPTKTAFVMTCLFLVTVILVFVLYGMMEKNEREQAAYRSDAEQKLLGVTAEKAEAEKNLAALQEEKAVLEAECKQLHEQLDALKNGSQSQDRVEELKKELQEKTEQLKKLWEEIEAHKSDNTVYDLSKTTALVTELDKLIETGAPYRTESVQSTDEYGTVIYVKEQVYPHVSAGYLNLETGLMYINGADTVYRTKDGNGLALALSILEKASMEKASGSQNTEEEGTLYYDLSRTYIYKTEDAVPGSSIIKSTGPGKEYSHLDLIRLLLQYGDSVAYARLVAEYGTQDMDELLLRLDCTVAKDNPQSLTVSDAIRILREAYRFMTGDAYYAETLRESLLSAAATSLSTQLSTIPVARQFSLADGLCHEMNIVMDDTPYITVILTDMGYGGDDVSAFLASAGKKMTELHASLAG